MSAKTRLSPEEKLRIFLKALKNAGIHRIKKLIVE